MIQLKVKGVMSNVYTCEWRLTSIIASQISIPCALFSHVVKIPTSSQDIEEEDEDEEDEDEEYGDEDEEEMSAVFEAALAEDIEVPAENSNYDKV